MSPARGVGARLAAAVAGRIEPLQQLVVLLSGGELAEGRKDVEPEQVLVPLAGCVLELGDLEPLLNRLSDGDVDLGACSWSTARCRRLSAVFASS
jgi:hypothetical protein